MPRIKDKKRKKLDPIGTRYFEIYEDRRQYPRIVINQPIDVTKRDGTVVHTVAYNISPDGLQLITDRNSARSLNPSGAYVDETKGPGVKIHLKLPLTEGPEVLEAYCKIYYFAVLPDGGIAFGLRFKRIHKNGRQILERLIEEYMEPVSVPGNSDA